MVHTVFLALRISQGLRQRKYCPPRRGSIRMGQEECLCWPRGYLVALRANYDFTFNKTGTYQN